MAVTLQLRSSSENIQVSMRTRLVNYSNPLSFAEKGIFDRIETLGK
jgi:hypothetical protein